MSLPFVRTLSLSFTLSLVAPAAAQPGGAPATAGTAGAGAAAGRAKPAETASAELKDATGKSVGRITLETIPKGLLLRGDLQGLPAGEHAIHLHETGLCEPPFKTAGGHFNPAKKQHGLRAAKGHHAGDLPNISVGEGGRAVFEHHTSAVKLGKGGTSVFDKDGTAIVIHASADDHATDPAGNAGDRIACGVITRPDGTGGAPTTKEPAPAK